MSKPSAGYEKQIGAHIFRFEPPDVCFMAYIGDVSGGDLLAVGAELTTLNDKDYMAIISLEHAGSFSTEAKKGFRHVPPGRCTAVFGASTQLRIVASILDKVYSMVHQGTNRPSAFFDTEKEARAWIEKQRQQR